MAFTGRRLAIGVLAVTLAGVALACRSPERAATTEGADVKLFGFGKKAAQAAIPEIDREVPPVVRTATFAVG